MSFMIENAFIRVYNRDNNEELCRFELTDDFKGKTAIICGEIYKKDGESLIYIGTIILFTIWNKYRYKT